MKISPYIIFNGNCEEAVKFYERAFMVEADIMRYSDAPQEDGYQVPEGTGNLIMHAQFNLDDAMLMLCDAPPDSPVKVGDNIAIMLEFESVAVMTMIFDALKVGGNVSMELQETFWSKRFGSLTDKFGINWNISVGCPQ